MWGRSLRGNPPRQPWLIALWMWHTPQLTIPMSPRRIRLHQVLGGDHLQVNVHLSPVPALTLSFHILRDSAGGYIVPQVQQPTFGEIVQVQPCFESSVSEETVEISGIPAGKYNIFLSGQGNGEGVQLSGVDLANDQEVDLSGGEVLAKVKISAQILGERALPPNLAVALHLKRSVRIQRERLSWSKYRPACMKS